jgi:hypothetical protein
MSLSLWPCVANKKFDILREMPRYFLLSLVIVTNSYAWRTLGIFLLLEFSSSLSQLFKLFGVMLCSGPLVLYQKAFSLEQKGIYDFRRTY